MIRRRHKPKQLDLAHTKHEIIRGRGGRRPGAGRPRIHDPGREHRRRPSVSPKIPVHVTLRMTERTWNLRSERSFRVIERALFAVSQAPSARIVHFSVQGNHMHMLIEADDRRALSSCMRSLGIRLGRGLNAMMRGGGRVVAHRYHARALRTPTEVYRALGYVRHNAAVHAARRNRPSTRAWVDRFSSDAPLAFVPPTATSWLLDRGWRRALPRGTSPIGMGSS
jgi:REP element-mobilizing transposase RayT